MKRDYILEDNTQIRRMKELALSWNFTCSGELYKLLSLETLHNLVNNIENYDIRLHNKLFNNNSIMSSEESFLLILDNYIGYVRDNYLIEHNELIIILEQSLKNRYNSILFSKKYYFDNIEYFLKEFKKMFLYNIVDNIEKYYKYDVSSNCTNINNAYLYINKKDLLNNENINEIEKHFIKLFNNKRNNIYYIFVPYDNLSNKDKIFNNRQVNNILGN